MPSPDVLDAGGPSTSPVPTAMAPWVWRAVLLAWLVLLSAVPDPQPLGAPDWAVAAVRSVAGLAEPGARAVATMVLRVAGLAVLGALLVFAVGGRRWRIATVAAILAAPLLAIGSLWINYGYFPIAAQLQVAAVSAALGAVAGLALRRNLAAAVALVLLAGGLFAWGTATGISDRLDVATRATGRHLLAAAERMPDGDPGFVALLQEAFAFAAENSVDADPVLPNRAAILAMGVILGEEKLATVAGRRIDAERIPEAEALRARITAHGRKDWPRHFWVSAGLTVLSGAGRSIAVGLTKELMDATPGGTGFSFPDLAADASGNRFTLAATRDVASARAMQELIAAGVTVADVVPDVRDLPEGMSREVFQEQYGGLGGAETQRIVEEIRRRLAACRALQ